MPRTQFSPSNTPAEQKIFLNAREVAQLLSVTPVTVCRLIQRGELLGAKVGRGYLTPRTAVDAYVNQKIQRRKAA